MCLFCYNFPEQRCGVHTALSGLSFSLDMSSVNLFPFNAAQHSETNLAINSKLAEAFQRSNHKAVRIKVEP